MRGYVMSSLFIFGNGFDIAHGISSKYSDFRDFIIALFPEALELRDEIVYLEDTDYIDSEEFAAEILLNTMDTSAGENWCNFEEALGLINFDNKFPLPNHKENESDEEDYALMKQYLLYMDILTSGFINCSKSWEDFFRLWIKGIQKRIDIGEFKARENLQNLFSEAGAQFLTFNYTKTLQKLYGVKKVIHIHNRVGQKLIWGHEKEDVSYNQFNENPGSIFFSSSFLDDMLMSFKKDTSKPLKKYNDFFKNLDHSIDKVYSYGFSYGEVDSIYMKQIISKINPDATWYFTTYEAQNAEELEIKKNKLREYGFKGIFAVFEG